MTRSTLIVTLVVVLLVGSCSAPYVLHHFALVRVRKAYSQITHPKSSSALDLLSQVALLSGNGDHCDYFVGEIRESDESPDEIKAYYSGLSIQMMDPDSSQWGPTPNVPVRVEFPDQRGKIDPAVDDMFYTLQRARAKQSKKTLYVVYVLDGGYEPNFDLRCY